MLSTNSTVLASKTQLAIRFLRDEAGTELAEYALAATLVAAIAVIVYAVFGDGIFTATVDTAETIKSASYVAPDF